MKLTAKQNEYIRNATRRWNFKVGAVRSGKSFVDVAYSIPKRIRERSGKSGLTFILGVSKATIERNVLEPMREIYTDRLVGTIKDNDNIARLFGEDVYCLGAEKVSQVAKIQGSSIKYCYGDEIAKWNEEVFNYIPSRLDKKYSCFEGACNPEYPNHWLKEFIDRDDIDKYVQHYTLFDNPNLPPDVVDSICTEYDGTIYYSRLVLGEWVRAEGLVYPNYANTVPTVPRDYAQYVVSMDYGTMNPTAMILWGRKGLTWYAVKEYYYSGRETNNPLTDEDYYNELDKLTKDVPVPAYDKIPLIIDPSAASFIALAKRNQKFKVRKADNDVVDGIRLTSSALAAKKILFNDCCVNTIKEFGLYSWDGKSQVDCVIKDNDHCLDGETMIHTLFGKKRIKDLVGKRGWVWSYDERKRRKVLRRFRDVRQTAKDREMLRITFANGKTVECTPDHLILTQRGWVEAGELDTTDYAVDIMDTKGERVAQATL